MRTPIALTLLCLSLTALSGCSDDGLNRTAISGSVTFAGQPLRSGLVSFRPAAGRSGPAASTPLVDGRYEFSTANGPVAGNYDVAIMIGSEDAKQAGPLTRGDKLDGGDLPSGAVILLRNIEIAPGSMVKDLALDRSMIDQK